MSKAEVIKQAFRDRGPMTIQECMHVTGYHVEGVRRVVRPPVFRAVGEQPRPYQNAVIWELVNETKTGTSF